MKDALGAVQSVLVLGGGSDIAQATVRELVGRRARRVVLAARQPDALAPFAAELRLAGAEVTTVPFDADALDAHAAFVDTVWHDQGGGAGVIDHDCVLLAFGTLGDQAAAEHDAAAAVEAITTNFTAAASLGVLIADRLRAQGHGTLIVLSSVAGERVRRANFVYGSAKAGMDAFFLGLCEALRGSGARVMVVRPGFVHTKMTAGMPPAPLATTAERVAADIVAGLARDAELLWSPRAMRFVMAALRHVPRPLFRRLPI
jgi:decaprenylphospho-beta-D-erythro-pentofuranosid-2-ulose 2-reductase